MSEKREQKASPEARVAWKRVAERPRNEEKAVAERENGRIDYSAGRAAAIQRP
jgi:hypothetical protein